MLSRRDALLSAAGAVLSSPAVLRGGRRLAGDKPNLLFLWTDEQRADTLAAYGNTRYRVPALNRLASESVVFDRCYDTQPVCTPARSSVMTGHWPHANGCLNNNIALPPNIPCFPELLADSAYRTAYFGKWHLGDEVFAQHGFQEWVSIEDIYDQHFSVGRSSDQRSNYHHFLIERGYKPGPGNKFSRNFAAQLPIEQCKPAFLADRASGFILKRRAEPWMLYVNFLEPHLPFTGPLNDLHSADEAPVPSNYPGYPVEKEPRLYCVTREGYLKKGSGGQDLTTRAGWQRLNRNYAGLCAQVDQAVGRILWALDASGQAENTIIVFTSDHGEMMGSHSLIGISVFYEESVRVPLLLRVPFRKHGLVRVDRPVSHIGLVPTLLELMGRRVPDSLPGESLMPLVRGGTLRDDHVYVEWHTPRTGPNGRTVISPDGWKLSLYDTDNCLLFNRSTDPGELQNLYYLPASGPIIQRLRAKLDAWQRRTGDKQFRPV